MTVLTGCKTPETSLAVSNSQVIRNMVPELPELPEWPKLHWEFRDGFYCLTEADVDKILDYWENRIPAYRSEIELYKTKLKIIIDHLE